MLPLAGTDDRKLQSGVRSRSLRGDPNSHLAQTFGKITSEIKPRHTVVHHFFNEESTRYAIYEGVRETYHGPLSMATDMMVWNVTKDTITERMVVSTDEATSLAGDQPPPVGEPDQVPPQLSADIEAGTWDVSDAKGNMVRECMERFDLQPAQK